MIYAPSTPTGWVNAPENACQRGFLSKETFLEGVWGKNVWSPLEKIFTAEKIHERRFFMGDIEERVKRLEENFGADDKAKEKKEIEEAVKEVMFKALNREQD